MAAPSNVSTNAGSLLEGYAEGLRYLRKDFAERLDPYVRDKFLELCESVEESKTS
jgi:hypothetical protein